MRWVDPTNRMRVGWLVSESGDGGDSVDGASIADASRGIASSGENVGDNRGYILFGKKI